jgi:DNA-binding NarL/FixJ family response regulator
VDDHNIVRQGIRSLLEREPGFVVVGEAMTGREAVKMVKEIEADIVLMDVSMPDLNGIEATRQIAGDKQAPKVLALSMHADRRFVVGILEAGASGYLLKDCAYEEMISAVKSVMNGYLYLSPTVTGVVIQDYVKHLHGSKGSMHDLLSSREKEVLQLLTEGASTKQIAESLIISVKTVETHRRQIMEKLEIHTVAELTKYALREGLTMLE